MTNRLDEALTISEDILSGIEMETLSTSSAAWRCLKLARLLNDDENILWLKYECSGYPKLPEGFIDREAFEIGCRHGRESKLNEDKSRTGNFQLASELESRINTLKESLKNITTQGVSLSGDKALIAMQSLTSSIANQTGIITNIIVDNEHTLSVIRGEYYRYALNANLTLKFSQQAEDIFNSYRIQTDANLLRFSPKALQKLDAAYTNLTSKNSESWSQALSSCRRVFQELSDSLFVHLSLDKLEDNYKTKSGKELEISISNYKNRLFAVVDVLSDSKTSRQLLGSEILLLVDWIENIHELLSKGVHEIKNPITFEEARSGVIRTYMLLGSLSNLLD